MEILLTIIMGGYLFYTLKLFDYDIMNPAVLYNSTWFVSSLIYTIFFTYWQMPLHLNTFLVIVLGNLAFNIPCILLLKKHAKVKKQRGSNFIHRNFKYAIIIYLVLFFIYSYYHEYLLAIQADENIMWYEFSRILEGARVATVHLDAGNSRLFVNGMRLNYILSILFFYDYCLVLNNGRFSVINKSSLIISIILGAMTILSGGRTILLGIIAGNVCIYFYIFYNRNSLNKTLFKKIACFLVVSLMIFILIFTFLNLFILRRMHSGNLIEIISYTAKYISSGIPDLDYFLNHRELYGSSFFGASTFNSIWVTLKSIGISSFEPIGEINKFVPDTGTFTSNVYTVYYQYIYDFGYLSVPIFQLMNGSIFAFIYKRVLCDKKELSFNILIYAILAYPIIMMFFQENLWSIINTHIIRIIMVVGIFYILVYCNKNIVKIKTLACDIFTNKNNK